jgi:Host cell surface-exposed lipoprotein
MGRSGSYGAWDDHVQQAAGGRQYRPPVVPPEFGGQQRPDPGAQRQPYPPQYQPGPQQPQFTPQPQYTAPPGYQPPYPPGPQQPPYQQQYAPQPPKRNRHTGRKVFAGIGAFIVLMIVIGVATSSGHGTQTSGSLQAAAPAQGAAPAKPAAKAKAAAKAPAAAPASTGPAGTVSELEALAAAQNYLADGQGFSRQGLIGQLDSPDGDSFSVADATWGVDHSGANWDEQAVDSAKGYMNDGEGFSREGLIDQMTSAYGDQFTEAQAEYAANAVGL